jgi:isoquinoline 1-oxidoreductase beta subunit
VAMTIADEMGMPLDKVRVTLADARPELVWNQITAGSNSMHSIFTPVRVAAAIARERLLETAARFLGQPLGNLSLSNGVITSVTGQTVAVADLARLAAVPETIAVQPTLKSPSQFTLIGTPQRRIDAHDIVTGAKVFAMDLDLPGALPTMLCRAPTINASAVSVRNLDAVKSLPGITDVVIIPHTNLVPGGVAVRGQTFGQCITAIRALDVVWGPGTVDGKSDATVLADLRANELPMLPPLLGKVIEDRFIFHFRPGDPLETNCAVADVRSDRAEVWAALKTPIWCKEQLALNLGLPLDKVSVHVVQAGGSFGRHLFPDAAFEAAAVSRALGKPVKLMWHRTDNFRQGRVHPMCTSHVRLVHLLGNVLTFDQRHTSVSTDFTQGFGELLTAIAATLPGANGLGFAQLIFSLTANVPYNFGVVTQLINEIYAFNTFNTSSVRNIYSPEVCTAKELIVDRAARSMGKDPLSFRREFVRDARLHAVLDRVASAGNWGRAMPAGTAQGIALHKEYKGAAACLVEIDCRPATVNRQVPDAYTGPRVTKVVYAVDVGLPINPLGLEAQMMGGIMDGIAQALSYSLHLQSGHFLEGSWDNAYYTRQWNTPPSIQIIIMPTSDSPGGAGEFGVAATMAAVACAYARATGTNPTRFPINHDLPLGFTSLPTVPSIPESPTDGLEKAF